MLVGDRRFGVQLLVICRNVFVEQPTSVSFVSQLFGLDSSLDHSRRLQESHNRGIKFTTFLMNFQLFYKFVQNRFDFVGCVNLMTYHRIVLIVADDALGLD